MGQRSDGSYIIVDASTFGHKLSVGLNLSGHLTHAVHHRGQVLLRRPKPLLELVLFDLKQLDLVPLALARVVSGQPVALDSLDPTLFLFVLGLCAFAWREICLWLGQLLAPRLAFPVGFCLASICVLIFLI